MKNKKGNAGLVVLVTLLFVVVIAMAVYIAYDKLYVKDEGDVVGGNQNNVQQEEENKYKINSLAEASDLVEKYYFFEMGEKYYITDMNKKEYVALAKTIVSDKISQAQITNTASYTNEATYLNAATFESANVDFYSYEDVQKTVKELFGQNAVIEKKTYLSCPNAYFYLKELNGFVSGTIGCGAGGGYTEELKVYNYENTNETLYIYARLTLTGIGSAEGEIKTEAYKYTFKLQDTGYYLANVEKI